MASRPLEKLGQLRKNKKEVLGGSAVNKIIDDGRSTVNNVLGQTKKIIVQTAADSTKSAEDFIIKNTVDKIMGQLDKLPEREKEVIKKEICK